MLLVVADKELDGIVIVYQIVVEQNDRLVPVLLHDIEVLLVRFQVYWAFQYFYSVLLYEGL